MYKVLFVSFSLVLALMKKINDYFDMSVSVSLLISNLCILSSQISVNRTKVKVYDSDEK